MADTYIKDYTNTFMIHGREYEVTAPAKFDSETNELLDDTVLDDQAVEIANNKYRADMGLVSPEDIKKYRAKIGLSQRELAKFLGWSPNTIALYETGAFPSKGNNRLLKALMSDDHLLTDFLEQDDRELSSTIIGKIKDYLNAENNDVILEKASKPHFTAVQLANWYRVINYFSAQDDENIENLTQMKVVKLLYFAFGRYAAKSHGKLFDSRIIAMPYGPVIEEVHQNFNGQRDIVSGGLDEKAFKDFSLVQEDVEITTLLRGILDDYGDQTASGLSKITHQAGSPWSLTNQGAVINPTLIAETFARGAEQ